MPRFSSQKFINRNRKPRVHIEYDVQINNQNKRIELPFVMGVLADLSGKPSEPLPAVADRKFVEFDVDNFDERMKAIKPRVNFPVPNVLSDAGGNIPVDVTFESMDDFSPAAIARKVDALNTLLQAREQLDNLGKFIDGRKAEEMIADLLKDKALLQALAAGAAAKPKEKE